MDGIIQAVPNFSEGKDSTVYERIIDIFRKADGVKLIDYFPDVDFNRTVVTVLGRPGPLKEALLKMTELSVTLIDMRRQTGAHPRIGALDTIPVLPLKGITLEECRDLAEQIGHEIFKRFKVPVYFSGANARKPERRDLDHIRRGGFEALLQVAHTPERSPDIGPPALHPSAGAVIVSAGTQPLVAYNVMLGTDDLEVAKKIAKIVRGPTGGFVSIRAIGMIYQEQKRACVSMNVFDHRATPLYRLFELVRFEAARYNVPVVASQLVGVVPSSVLLDSVCHYLKLDDFKREQILEEHLHDL
ncbi:MAG: glutamate formimidoyltransferase [bacterium]